MKIKLLDSSVSNCIAAGEVVERPASIVKELLENSIDAGATGVTVEIRQGGIEYLRISDNGCGIEPDDVKQAFLRHATSKIEKAEDLNNILTLGFRGEALASVAAVSSVNLVTRIPNAEEGTEIQLEGGEILRFCACGCPEGTTIKVENLFFNTPVRKKFLKKPAQESMHVNDVINRIALSNPQLSIRYIVDGKTILHTPGDNRMLSTIRAIFGSAVSENMIELDEVYNDIHIYGYIGSREIQRANRSRQIIFINGRCVVNKLISDAAQSAYQGRLNVGKFPFFVLNIDLPSNLVDVNVHPTKQEVRFAEGLDVYGLVYNAVSNTLRKNQEIPTLFAQEKQAISSKVTVVSSVTEDDTVDFDKIDNTPQGKPEKNFEKSKDSSFTVSDTDARRKPVNAVFEKPSFENVTASDKNSKTVKDFAQYVTGSANKVFDLPSSFVNSHLKNDTANTPASKTVPEQQAIEISDEDLQYELVGVLFNTYIVLTAGEDAFIVDQHAAHERLLFERFYAACEKGTNSSQPMLVPVIVDLSPKEALRLDDLLPALSDLGFEIEAIGENSYGIKAVPSILDSIDPEQFIQSILNENVNSVRSAELKREKLMQTSCKHAVKGGDKLSDGDIKALMQLIVKENVPLSCPHGRPILIRLSKRELEVRFKRIQ